MVHEYSPSLSAREDIEFQGQLLFSFSKLSFGLVYGGENTDTSRYSVILRRLAQAYFF
jgi:hypothetical protein